MGLARLEWRRTAAFVAVLVLLAVPPLVLLQRRPPLRAVIGPGIAVSQTEAAAQTRPLPAFPLAQARIDTFVAALKEETLEESVQRLDISQPYYLPGTVSSFGMLPASLPLAPIYDRIDIERCASNRRFMKVIDQARSLQRAALVKLLTDELGHALRQYDGCVDEFVKVQGPMFEIGTPEGDGGPSFMPFSDERATLTGCKYKVLALALVMGNLRLEECGDAVQAAARYALSQYDRLQHETRYRRVFSLVLLTRAGLYSRQALATGLIGTSTSKRLKQLYAGRLTSVTVPRFSAKRTQYDVGGGVIGPDKTAGWVEVRYVGGDLTDTEFIQIAEMARVKE